MIYNILSIWKFLYPLQAPDKVLKSLLGKKKKKKKKKKRKKVTISTPYILDSKPSAPTKITASTSDYKLV
jgi:hypothetical protein